MAWSDGGYTDKTWKLPEDWDGCTGVDLYSNTLTGVSFRETLPVRGNAVTMSLGRRDGVIILPHGEDPAAPGKPPEPSGTAEFINLGSVKPPLPAEESGAAHIKGPLGLHEAIEINAGDEAKIVSLYFEGRDGADCQAVLDVIGVNSPERIGENTTKLLYDFGGGLYITYKITGRVRFRLTKFHFDHFGRGDGKNEAVLPDFIGIFTERS
jgi:hypothetical protein